MASLDDDLDRLYQLPLAEFTAARNELAKRAGIKGIEIRRLEKPNAAAWAVNQLFWRHRKTFDALVAASNEVRRANAKGLAGKAVDLAGLGDRHRQALDNALGVVTTLLKESGDSASPQTLSAISRTLDAVPSDESAERPTMAPFIGALAIIVVVVIAIWLFNVFGSDNTPQDQRVGTAAVGQNDALQRENFADLAVDHGDHRGVASGRLGPKWPFPPEPSAQPPSRPPH